MMAEKKDNTEPSKLVKSFTCASDDPRIEVVFRAEGMGLKYGGDVEVRSFRASTIDYLESVGDNNSVIVLRSGVRIRLSLSHAALAEKIDMGYSLIDLKDHCIVPDKEFRYCPPPRWSKLP